jgi:tetratricopeptide (TPR) repeat protein
MAFGGEDAESYYDEGLTAGMRGDITRAIQFLEKAIQLDNSFRAAYHQLAKCYLRLGDGPKAVSLLQHVIKNTPSSLPARLDLGAAYVAMGDLERARQQYSQVVDAQPDSGRGYLGLAQVAFHQGNWDGALQLAQQAKIHGGSNFAVLYLLGRAAKLAGNVPLSQESLKEANMLMDKSIELNPTQPEGYFLRGEVAFALDQFSTALEQYRAAEDRADKTKVYSAFGENFGFVDILAKEALCYQRLDREDRARELGERIVQINPNHKLGQALKEL